MKLNFKSFGQGPPLLILHGLFGQLDNWQQFAKQLANDFSVYIIDQRNHGRSPHVDEMNYPVLADDLRSFMEDHWIHRSHILGHSMGGKTAMQFAFDHPEMIDRLIVVDIGPNANPDRHKEIFEAMEGLDIAKLQSRKEAEAMLANTITDAGVRLFLLKNLNRNPAGGYTWKVNLPVLHRDFPDILAAVSGDPFEGPALFVRGGQSDYIKNKDWTTAQALFPAAELHTIPEAGHWVHADASEDLIRKVRQFLLPPD